MSGAHWVTSQRHPFATDNGLAKPVGNHLVRENLSSLADGTKNQFGVMVELIAERMLSVYAAVFCSMV